MIEENEKVEIKGIAGVVVLTNREGKVLAVRRKSGENVGKWGLPGGKAEGDENAAVAAGRETREETGCIVSLQTAPPVHKAVDCDGYETTAYTGQLIDIGEKNDGEAEHAWVDRRVLTDPHTGAYPEFNNAALNSYYDRKSFEAEGYAREGKFYDFPELDQQIYVDRYVGYMDATHPLPLHPVFESDPAKQPPAKDTYFLVSSIQADRPSFMTKYALTTLQWEEISYYDYKQAAAEAARIIGLYGKVGPDDDDLVNVARHYAITHHNAIGQTYDGKPYSIHLKSVADEASSWGWLLPNDRARRIVKAAAWCHDVLEDPLVTYSDLLKVVGKEVTDLVFALSNHRGRNRDERAPDVYYADLAAFEEGLGEYCKLCDRLANVGYRGSMVKKYKKEMPTFEGRLRVGDRFKRMWDELHGIFIQLN